MNCLAELKAYVVCGGRVTPCLPLTHSDTSFIEKGGGLNVCKSDDFRHGELTLYKEGSGSLWGQGGLLRRRVRP